MSKKTLKNFALEDFFLYEHDEDPDIAVGEVWALADGNNSHNNPISLDVLKDGADTMLGKFLVAKYSTYAKDVTTHTTDQSIIGYFPKDQVVKFKEKDGKTFVVYDVCVSKIYATKVYEIFKGKNHRHVSVEFTCLEGEENPDGSTPIEDIIFHGCTILGLDYTPSCSGAEMTIKQFADNTNDEIAKFVAEKKIRLVGKTIKYKINKDELKTTEWGDVNKTAMRKKIVVADNKKTLVKSVYALVEDGWEDNPSQKLKYPLMQLVKDTFYYNRYALSTALAYAEQNNEEAVITKINKLYKKFDIKAEGGIEKDMSKKKKFKAVSISDIWSKIYNALEKKYPDNIYGSLYRIKGVYEEDNTKFAIIYAKDDEENTFRIDFSLTSEDGLQFADEMFKTTMEFKTETKGIKFEDIDPKYTDFEDEAEEEVEDEDDTLVDEEDEASEEDKEDEEKKMVADADAWMGAMLALLNAEGESDKEIAKGNMEVAFGENYDNIIMEELYEAGCEFADLKLYKAEVEKAKKEKDIMTVLEEVKQDLNTEKYDELVKMSESVIDVAMFVNTAKAFAYENSKKANKNKNTENIYMGGSNSNEGRVSNEYVDPFEKILNK